MVRQTRRRAGARSSEAQRRQDANADAAASLHDAEEAHGVEDVQNQEHGARDADENVDRDALAGKDIDLFISNALKRAGDDAELAKLTVKEFLERIAEEQGDLFRAGADASVDELERQARAGKSELLNITKERVDAARDRIIK